MQQKIGLIDVDGHKGHDLRKLARWVNNRFIFAKCKTFEEYKKGI